MSVLYSRAAITPTGGPVEKSFMFWNTPIRIGQLGIDLVAGELLRILVFADPGHRCPVLGHPSRAEGRGKVNSRPRRGD